MVGVSNIETIQAGRFNYVRYDEEATKKQAEFKAAFEDLERLAEVNLPEGRAKALFLTHLEIAYMWTGKAIRDEQIGRGVQVEDVPTRTNE